MIKNYKREMNPPGEGENKNYDDIKLIPKNGEGENNKYIPFSS